MMMSPVAPREPKLASPGIATRSLARIVYVASKAASDVASGPNVSEPTPPMLRSSTIHCTANRQLEVVGGCRISDAGAEFDHVRRPHELTGLQVINGSPTGDEVTGGIEVGAGVGAHLDLSTW